MIDDVEICRRILLLYADEDAYPTDMMQAIGLRCRSFPALGRDPVSDALSPHWRGRGPTLLPTQTKTGSKERASELLYATNGRCQRAIYKGIVILSC